MVARMADQGAGAALQQLSQEPGQHLVTPETEVAVGVDAVLRAVEVEGGLGALVQYGASGHKGDLGGGPTHVQGAHQGPLQRPDPFSREGILDQHAQDVVDGNPT